MRSVWGLTAAAFEGGARTVAGRGPGWSLEGDTGRIFAGDGDRRAVALTCGRKAPLILELVPPLAFPGVGGPLEFVHARAVLLIFARTTMCGEGEIDKALDGLVLGPLMF